ncbi:MAG: hypothetical protein HMLIMOIP_002382 [Candidatus Nitrosomirales archaeon]|jgi:hypothetical protein
MPSKFAVPDVSSEAIMTVVKLVSSAPSPLSLTDIAKGVENKFKQAHAKLVVDACLQLKLLQENNATYNVNPKYRDSVKRAAKEELVLFFRQALQDYPPFLLYADLVSQNFPSVDSVNMIRGALQIDTPAKTVEKSLRNWGKDAGLIVETDGKLSIPQAEKGLPSNYVKELLRALDSEFNAKMFLINTLGTEVFSCLTTLDLDISDLAKSLTEYESDPKNSLHRSGKFFENYLYKLGVSISANVSGLRGANALIKALLDQHKIIKNQFGLGNGLGAARNIGSHDPDADTGMEWTVTPQASLATTLLIPPVVRSLYLYTKKGQQEF